MDNAFLVAEQLYEKIRDQDYEIEPYYFNKLKVLFETDQVLGTILKNRIIRDNDESIRLFLEIFEEYNRFLLNEISIANVCSGSGLMNEMLISQFNIPPTSITNFDKSEFMLKGSAASFCCDFSIKQHFQQKFNVVLSLGSLRYFYNAVDVFAHNISSLCSKNRLVIIGDINRNLVEKFRCEMENLELKGFIIRKEGVVFKNTLFYLLFEKYKRDRGFADLIRNTAKNNDPYEFLIQIAGFKKVTYYYFIWKNLSLSE